MLTTKMATRWVKALLSGRFKKITSQLRTTDKDGSNRGYCVLGVLAEVLITPNWCAAADNGGYGEVIWGLPETAPDGKVHSSVGFIPEAFSDQVPLDIAEQHRYVNLNDAERLSFEQLANVIIRDYDLDPGDFDFSGLPDHCKLT